MSKQLTDDFGNPLTRSQKCGQVVGSSLHPAVLEQAVFEFPLVSIARPVIAHLRNRIPDTQMVCVMEREADFFELFDEQRKKPRVELLVRAKHDRKTGADLTLFDAVRQSPLKSQFRLPVKRQSARQKRSKQKARDQVKPRTAQVELRYHPITLRPPSGHKATNSPSRCGSCMCAKPRLLPMPNPSSGSC